MDFAAVDAAGKEVKQVVIEFEGINNNVKVIKRVGFGRHDKEYFFYKIRSNYPGFDRP